MYWTAAEVFVRGRPQWLNTLAWALLALPCWNCVAAGDLENPAGSAISDAVLEPLALAERVDEYWRRAWEEAGTVPAAPDDDAEILRRLYLHIVGKIPTAAEAREFLDATAPDKQWQLVEELLSRAAFATHMASVWRELLLPGASNNPETVGLIPPLETWLRLRLADNTPYDRLVFELLTARLQSPLAMQALRAPPRRASPTSFYQYNEYKPENLAANVARVFLGVQVQCAQCHDHPFGRWKRTEFWSLAAFFTSEDVMAASGMDLGGIPGRSVKIPGLEPETVVNAAFLDGSSPD